MPHVWIATPAEAVDVARLLSAFRSWYGKDRPTEAEFLAGVRRLISTRDAEYLLGAADESRPAVAVAQIRYRHSLWTTSDDCWLEDLYVEGDARSAGLGRAMVQAVLERARARGCGRVELDVDDANAPARRLYESLGFAEKGGGSALMQRRLD